MKKLLYFFKYEFADFMINISLVIVQGLVQGLIIVITALVLLWLIGITAHEVGL